MLPCKIEGWFWRFFVPKWQCLCENFIQKIQNSTKNSRLPMSLQFLVKIEYFCLRKTLIASPMVDEWRMKEKFVVFIKMCVYLCVDIWNDWRHVLEAPSFLLLPCGWILIVEAGHWVHFKTRKNMKMKEKLEIKENFDFLSGFLINLIVYT